MELPGPQILNRSLYGEITVGQALIAFIALIVVVSVINRINRARMLK